jgi:hypothetical protein
MVFLIAKMAYSWSYGALLVWKTKIPDIAMNIMIQAQLVNVMLTFHK